MKNRNSLNIMHKGISLISKSWETGDLLREYDKDSHIHYYIQKFWSPTVITCQIGRQAPMPLWECMDDMVRVGSYFDENIDYTSDHLAENGNTEHKEGKEA